jgi:hypothetical protein
VYLAFLYDLSESRGTAFTSSGLFHSGSQAIVLAIRDVILGSESIIQLGIFITLIPIFRPRPAFDMDPCTLCTFFLTIKQPAT